MWFNDWVGSKHEQKKESLDITVWISMKEESYYSSRSVNCSPGVSYQNTYFVKSNKRSQPIKILQIKYIHLL